MANTLYWVTYSSALSAPSGAQIVAGHDINNNAGEAWGTGNAAWTGDGQYVDFTGASGGAFKTAGVIYDGSNYGAVAVSSEWNLTAAFSLTGDSGSYAYSGSDSGLLATKARYLSGNTGAYASSGGDAVLTHSIARYLSADAGTYSYSGSDATLDYVPYSAGSYNLSGTSGNYSYLGGDSTLHFTRAYILDAASGAYTLTGGDATLDYQVFSTVNYSLSGTAGAYSVNGGNASLSWSGEPATEPSGGGRGSKQRKIHRIIYERIENVEDFVDAMESEVLQEPKVKAKLRKVKKLKPETVENTQESAKEWIAYYDDLLQALRDQQKADQLRQDLAKSSYMLESVLRDRELKDLMRIEKVRMEEDMLILLMGA